ncbi:sensor histidine kinase [Mucilaginibacter calamicampi]|uniref:Sensor histidine kinase n=1 Tax=Mucilaginibacter calamicampi TaxID=1302352 RepID=A0ABW2YTC9_9SPHI
MNRSLQFSSPIYKHILGWAIFITYEVTFVRLSVGHSGPLLNYFCYYTLNIALFYFNAYALLASAQRRRLPYLAIILLMLLELLVYLVLKYLMDGWLASAPDPLSYIRNLLVPNLYRGILFVGYSTLYWSVISAIIYQRKAYETERARLVTLKEKAELEKNLAESVNAYLQQQINPHFLFNTLTFIHNTYYKYSREASRCVMLLSDITRFSFEDVGSKGKTLLAKEIEQIYNFIELNKIRFDHELCLRVEIKGEFEKQEIIPLILITLTENIFKYGYLKNKSAPARLSIDLNEAGELHFESWNLKKHEPANRRIRAIGIRNTIKRLEYSYPDRYILDIRNEPDSYQLNLKICL